MSTWHLQKSKEGDGFPWNQSHRGLSGSSLLRVLGTELWPYARTVSTAHHRATSPVPLLLRVYVWVPEYQGAMTRG